jgi:hypothetical protein
MKASQEDNMHGKKLYIRFLELAFGGLLYIEMLNNILEPTMCAKELENHPEEMKFH